MLYELKVYGRYYGQRTINDFNFVIDSVPVGMLGSYALVQAFGAIADPSFPADKPFIEWINFVSQYWSVERIVARAPRDYDVTDFYELVGSPIDVGNITTSDTQAPQSAYGIVSNRVRTDINPGSKRFAGVVDTNIDPGGVVAAGMVALIETFCDLLSAPISYTSGGATATFDNCVVGKQEYTTPSGKRAYRYYPTLAEQLDHIARGVSWSVKPNVTTQNSRKYGRGV